MMPTGPKGQKRPADVIPDNPEQSKRFIDMAREVEADESPEAFERAFESVVKPKGVQTKKPEPERRADTK